MKDFQESLSHALRERVNRELLGKLYDSTSLSNSIKYLLFQTNKREMKQKYTHTDKPLFIK